jgi:hypothetical protein
MRKIDPSHLKPATTDAGHDDSDAVVAVWDAKLNHIAYFHFDTLSKSFS